MENTIEIPFKREFLDNCLADFKTKKDLYDKMYDYAIVGESDARKEYKNNPNRANLKVKTNFIKKFIKEERDYLLSNKITYISRTDNKEELNFIEFKTLHWSENHDKNLLRDLLTYGQTFELYYTKKQNNEMLFNSIIVSPREGYVYRDDFGNITLFMRFFKRKFDTTKQYIDLYTKNFIFHCDENFTQIDVPTPNTFGEVPVSVAEVSRYKELDTLYNELKDLQDAYETNLSDLVNEISDYRLAYFIAAGCTMDEKIIADMKSKGIINVSDKDIVMKFLTKDINDTFVQNTLNTLKKNIYELSSHIDTNEKLQSNTSGSALRNRLIGLEQRVRDSEGALKDLIQNRLYFMFLLFNKLNESNYDYRDVTQKFTLNIPQDDLIVAQVLSQLGIGENVSLQTGLAQLSFVSNPNKEIELIKAEKEANAPKIDLDGIGLDGGAKP
ncbi:phage portal protein [Clostridium cellulovorans]|uniref:Bacteriophage portal protein, SPP1 Gp6-like n=1 Tax=Clostridium cellulovorans (strain ATCC 35296 / DSM 3052 / OCM 3 / 743B) TaxID=573061 RepID=D9SWE2_CLOC7|nr:phage portal protein [Clostridium cellulovorans]ADL53224.1 Bacteriophage portal protein, SPP1 Gp6-like [Clostridium cellulovorans 743B]